MKHIRLLLFLTMLLCCMACGNNGRKSERVPRAIRKELKKHEVPQDVINKRIQSAIRDSARIKTLPPEEWTVEAYLLQMGMPESMSQYGDTVYMYYLGPEGFEEIGSCTYVFVRDTIDSWIVD